MCANVYFVLLIPLMYHYISVYPSIFVIGLSEYHPIFNQTGAEEQNCHVLVVLSLLQERHR